MKNYKSISKLLESLNLIDVNHVEVLSESQETIQICRC